MTIKTLEMQRSALNGLQESAKAAKQPRQP
jgi:hypothetical protein